MTPAAEPGTFDAAIVAHSVQPVDPAPEVEELVAPDAAAGHWQPDPFP